MAPMTGGNANERYEIEWDETTRYKAEVTAEEARIMFGLGGTPDDKVIGRVATLAVYDGGELAVLGHKVTDDKVIERKLRFINGRQPGELR